MKSNVIKTAARIGVVIAVNYLFKLHSKSTTGSNNSTIKANPDNDNKEEIEEPQSDTDRVPLFRIYDEKPEEFLEVYNRYMKDELTGFEAADLLGCGIDTFTSMVKYYRNKENLNETKYRTNKRLAKYMICDTNPELFLEVYIKFINKEINSREAAKEFGISVSTFYRSVRYYESKNGIRDCTSLYK